MNFKMLRFPVTGDEFLAEMPVGGVEDFHAAKIGEGIENGELKMEHGKAHASFLKIIRIKLGIEHPPHLPVLPSR